MYCLLQGITVRYEGEEGLNDLVKERVTQVIKLAEELGWFYPIEQPNKNHYSYPIMQLSEVEKCMIAMIDQNQFNQMKVWCGQKADYTSQNLSNVGGK